MRISTVISFGNSLAGLRDLEYRVPEARPDQLRLISPELIAAGGFRRSRGRSVRCAEQRIGVQMGVAGCHLRCE
jgi:hypothetical protein